MIVKSSFARERLIDRLPRTPPQGSRARLVRCNPRRSRYTSAGSRCRSSRARLPPLRVSQQGIGSTAEAAPAQHREAQRARSTWPRPLEPLAITALDDTKSPCADVSRADMNGERGAAGAAHRQAEEGA